MSTGHPRSTETTTAYPDITTEPTIAWELNSTDFGEAEFRSTYEWYSVEGHCL